MRRLIFSRVWGKSTPNDCKMTLPCARSKIPTCILPIIPTPKDSAFRSTIVELWPNLEKKYTELPNNDPDMFEVKRTHVHASYAPEAQIIVHFTLQWAALELLSNFAKSALNDPKMTCSRSRFGCLLHTLSQPASWSKQKMYKKSKGIIYYTKQEVQGAWHSAWQLQLGWHWQFCINKLTAAD